MLHAYIRVWKMGPSLDEQNDAIRKAAWGVSQAWVDGLRPPRILGAFFERKQALLALKPRDVLFVARPCVLGFGFTDVLQTLAWIEEQKASLFDVENGIRVDGISAALLYARQAAHQLTGVSTRIDKRILVGGQAKARQAAKN